MLDPLARRAIWNKASPSLTDRVQVISQWLERCFREHPTCGLVQTTYPARLLDLGSDPVLPSVKLVRLDQIEEALSPIRYVALSHCWGLSTRPPHKTTRANYSDHTRHIPIAALSRTFQDAIRVTRALGIRFIWIDSLCIIQDDADDWAAEAVKMASVYQGSYFTIAATSSPDGDGGLFLDPPAPATLVYVEPDNGLLDVKGNSLHSCFIRHPVASPSVIWDAPLSQRAWVLQEQILSARLIHFTEHQMYYQCNSGLESEDGIVDTADLSSVRGRAFRHHGKQDLRTPVRAVGTWWSWVADYSSRSLSFYSDRMAAIAGILRYYQDATRQVPILGLWEGTLWYDLGWTVEHDGSHDIAHCRIPAK